MIPEPPRSRHLVLRVVAGLLWRYGVLAGVLVYGETRASAPWLALLGLLGGGILLGLWHRRWLLARLWRTLVVACVAVFVGPMVPALYPDVIVGSLGALTAAPVVATWHRRNR